MQREKTLLLSFRLKQSVDVLITRVNPGVSTLFYVLMTFVNKVLITRVNPGVSTHQHFFLRKTTKTTFFTPRLPPYEGPMSDLAKKVFELFGKPETGSQTEKNSTETLPQTDPSWPCPHCGQLATIDHVGPSDDGERTITIWSCAPCEVVAVTPDAIRQPPSGWVPRTQQ